MSTKHPHPLQAAADLSAYFFELQDSKARKDICTVILAVIAEATARAKDIERAELKKRSLMQVMSLKPPWTRMCQLCFPVLAPTEST